MSLHWMEGTKAMTVLVTRTTKDRVRVGDYLFQARQEDGQKAFLRVYGENPETAAQWDKLYISELNWEAFKAAGDAVFAALREGEGEGA